MRQGIHTKSYPNGATYTGHYLDDKRHGFGLKVHADGVTTKCCYYENGQAMVYATHPLAHNYTYTRTDGYEVNCYGNINDTPQLSIHLGGDEGEQTITVQFYRIFASGNVLSTWRSWTNYLNKHSRFAGKIMRIESISNQME